MPLFALDAVRNAPIDQSVEILLEEMREQVAAFPFPSTLAWRRRRMRSTCMSRRALASM
jgi:hypothetical protein